MCQAQLRLQLRLDHCRQPDGSRSLHRIKPSVADVYEDLSPAVLGYLRGRGAAEPEDLTGDVFVKVTEGLGAFRGNRAALRRWVFTIAHNRLVDEFRRERPRRESVSADPPQSAVDDELPLDADVLEALTSLTEEQREVVVLRFIADLPLRDVARIVGKRTGAVKMLQARGLATLATALAGAESD